MQGPLRSEGNLGSSHSAHAQDWDLGCWQRTGLAELVSTCADPHLMDGVPREPGPMLLTLYPKLCPLHPFLLTLAEKGQQWSLYLPHPLAHWSQDKVPWLQQGHT